MTMSQATPYMRGSRALTSIYLRVEVYRALQKFSASTDTSMAHNLRVAVDEFLEKRGISVPKPRK
jgi:hypothetical protein